MASVGYVDVTTATTHKTLRDPFATAPLGAAGTALDAMGPHTRVFQAEDGITAMAVSGTSVWLALANGAMEVHDAHSGVVQHAFTAPTVRRPSASTRVWCLLFVTDESVPCGPPAPLGHTSAAAGEPQMWVGLSTGAIEVYHAETYTLLRQLRKHLSGVYCLAAEQSSAADALTRVVYSGSSDFQIAQWRLCDGRLLRVFKGHANYVRCLYAEGSALISGSDDGTVKVWQCDTGNVVSTGRFHIQANDAPATSAESHRQQPHHNPHNHRSGVSALCRVGVHMWSGDASGTLVVWRLKDCVALLVSHPHSGRITSLRKIGAQVYSGSADGTICVYAALDGTLSQRLQTNEHGGAARVMAVQCAVEVDRYFLWTGAADNTVRCWHHDEHVGMTEDRERFNDMRWYYATTQPFRESNESLLEQQRELAELVVLANGSDDAVKAYLSRNNEENQSAAARYWALESKVRDAQASTRASEEERKTVDAAVTLKQKALAVARDNLQKLLDAQKNLRASCGMPPTTATTAATAAGAPSAASGAAILPTPSPAPTSAIQNYYQTIVAPPPAVAGATAASGGTGTTAAPGTASATVPAPSAAPAAPPVPVAPSVLPLPSASFLPAAPAATSTASLPAAPSTAVPLPVVGPAATAVATSVASVPVVTASPPPPLPPPASVPAAVAVTTATTTTPAPAPPLPLESKVVTTVSASYEPDLSALPPPPPPAAGGPRSLAFPLPVAVAGVPPASVHKASHGPLSASNSPPNTPLRTTQPSAAAAASTAAVVPSLAPLPPPAPAAAPAAASTPFTVPPPPPAVVPQPPGGIGGAATFKSPATGGTSGRRKSF